MMSVETGLQGPNSYKFNETMKVRLEKEELLAVISTGCDAMGVC